MKKIWVLRYNDGTADVWDEEKGPPSWPYVDAFAADDAIKELHSDYADLRARVARLEETLRFVHDECDWEAGDRRIGSACIKALGATCRQK